MNNQRVFSTRLVFGILLLFFFPSLCFAGEFPITENTISEAYSSHFNGTVAWEGDTENSREIFYWDGSYDINGDPVIQQITDNTTTDSFPSLYNGTIAWFGDADGDYEIYYWDGSYDIDGDPVIQQITHNTSTDAKPSLYDGTIAWYGNADGDYEIYYWNGASTQQITHNSAMDSVPSLYDGTIAWEGSADGDPEIYYWNGSSTQQITNNSTVDYKPSLYNGKIAWMSFLDGEDWEIYYWDGSTAINVSDNTSYDDSPSLYNGTIAWWGKADGDDEIYYWDGVNTHQISDNIASDTHPSLYNEKVSWTSDIGGDREIYYWDGGVTSGLTISSKSFKHNQPINSKYTLYCENISPQLSWVDAPAGTESYGLVAYDRDADFYHWKVQLPKSTASLAENAGASGGGNLPVGSMRYNNQFYGSPFADGTDYDGPRPPSGSGVHHYDFILSALDASGGVIESVTITGTYEESAGCSSKGSILNFMPAIISATSGSQTPTPPPTPQPQPFSISSSSFTNNQAIPIKYTLYSDNISPQLSWVNAPAGTESFGLTVSDPDGGDWLHWQVRLPKATTSLGENAGASGGGNLPVGSVRYNNQFFGAPFADGTDYDGPRPPAGSGVHHYNFKLSALNASGGVIESVTITGTYEQP